MDSDVFHGAKCSAWSRDHVQHSVDKNNRCATPRALPWGGFGIMLCNHSEGRPGMKQAASQGGGSLIVVPGYYVLDSNDWQCCVGHHKADNDGKWFLSQHVER